MSGRVWYIDPVNGSDASAGESPSNPRASWSGIRPVGGDEIRFKRGSVIRGGLDTCNGDADGHVLYGAYGEGPRPMFLGSVAVGEDIDSWIEIRPGIWQHPGDFTSEVCNIVFDGGVSCGNLRWSLDELKQTGEWYYTGIGMAAGSNTASKREVSSQYLYLCSPDNPARYWSSVECVLWGARKLVGGKYRVVIEDLCFANSGVHGYQDVHPEDVIIRNCAFRFIGGGVWSLEHRVRFGNAVEMWDGARDVLVEGCLFDNIYDAGVTHQGGGTTHVPEVVTFRNNLFIDCGLSAYECREPSRDIVFEHNTCINSGGGFALQGEAPPRRSEIYLLPGDDGEPELIRLTELTEKTAQRATPIDVGHHVFIWRIDPGTQDGKVVISNNVFCEAPCGAAVYSIVKSQDIRHFHFEGNRYVQASGSCVAFVSGRTYRTTDIERLREDWNWESRGSVGSLEFTDPENGDYRLRDATVDAGIRVPVAID